MKHSRREFLKTSIQLATLMSTAPLLKACGTKQTPTIGYTGQTSYTPNSRVSLYTSIRAKLPKSYLELTELNGTLINTIEVQNIVQSIPSNAATHGYQWTETSSFIAPSKSGIYLIDSSIPLIVSDPNPGPITILIETNTVEAYNGSGGLNLYSKQNRPDRVHFQRPRSNGPLPKHSQEFLKWIPTQDLKISYITDQDMDIPGILDNTELLIVIGHSEYWTRTARQTYDNYVLSGGNVLLMSGNTMWWEVSYSNGALICPKSTQDKWTNTNYTIESSIASNFNYGGYPTDIQGGFKITLPSHPIFKSTGLKQNDILPLYSTELDGHKTEVLETLYSYTILGYDYGQRGSATSNICNILEFKFTQDSGTTLHIPSTDWTNYGIGGLYGSTFKTITLNSIKYLLGGN